MAALVCSASTPAEVNLGAGSPITVLQIQAPANQRLRLVSWSVAFDATTTSTPVEVRLLRQTSSGTMSPTTPAKLDDSLGEAVQTTASYNAVAEPLNTGEVLEVKEVHPSSRYEKKYPVRGRGAVIVGGGDRLGIECRGPATGGVSCRAEIIFEE